jgi:lytic murein transglycosylase
MLKKILFVKIAFGFCIIPNLAMAQDSFRQCVVNASNSAIKKGAPSQNAFYAIENINSPDNEIIALSKVQPESNLKIWDYLAFAIDDERAQDGANAYLQNRDFIYDLEAKTGVDRSTILGIWGMETNFGRTIGKRSTINALATLGCSNNRRSAYFYNELVAAIRIEANGHIAHNRFIGSWAGAFGQTQFMPTTFWQLAVDGNNDGRIDLVDQPQDALASTANFLKRAGWIRGQDWGYEVKISSSAKIVIGKNSKMPLSYWQQKGAIRADGKEFPKINAKYGIIFPAGRNGPAFLVGKNFDAVYAYNPAISYALAVNLSADRIKGSKGVYGNWPTDDPGISRAKKRDIQYRLIRAGFDVGQADGILGQKSIDAIKIIYARNGKDFTGRIGEKSYQTIIQLLQ